MQKTENWIIIITVRGFLKLLSHSYGIPTSVTWYRKKMSITSVC
jgi:hypothetical protein